MWIGKDLSSCLRNGGLQKAMEETSTLLKTPNTSQRSVLETDFPNPVNQREDQEQISSCVIIADSTTKPRGFPYPLLNMQVLINFCDNINIPDSLCGLLLPNVNLIIVCKLEVNLWVFKGAACELWPCCLFTAPHTTHFKAPASRVQ